MIELGRRVPASAIYSLRLIFVVAILAAPVSAQTESKPKRVHAPATLRRLVGGEANDTYVVRVRKGQRLTVQISWRKEDDNTASFGVGSSPALEPVSFGKEYDEGRKWVGTVPKTGDYFIEVVAHPSAHYVLKISVK